MLDTDTKRNAPTVICRMPKPPTQPTLVKITGDDLDELLRQAVGGEFKEVPLRDQDRGLGVIRVVCDLNEDVYAYVHTHPDAEAGLKDAIIRLKAELALVQVLRDEGVIPPDGCLCGQCGREVDPATAN